MNYNEYRIIIENSPETYGLEYNLAVTWLHPERLPLKLASLNGCTDKIIKLPNEAVNRYGKSVLVISIGKNAFKDNSVVTDIILSPNISYIGNNAFSGCTALERIVLPKKLKHIDKGAFAGCTALTDIYYEGTPDEWINISVELERHEYEYGELIPGTPVQKLTAERIIRIRGNEALKLANIHFHCIL